MKTSLDPVLLLLVSMMAFFVLVLIACEVFFVTDSQLFQVFANILSGLGGAFLLRIKQPSSEGGKSES